MSDSTVYDEFDQAIETYVQAKAEGIENRGYWVLKVISYGRFALHKLAGGRVDAPKSAVQQELINNFIIEQARFILHRDDDQALIAAAQALLGDAWLNKD